MGTSFVLSLYFAEANRYHFMFIFTIDFFSWWVPLYPPTSGLSLSYAKAGRCYLFYLRLPPPPLSLVGVIFVLSSAILVSTRGEFL